ncbi:MAG: hypothetical protein KZQ76_01135 [Candidatus Thiodiazotropha sp. (ex Epidulcina cf. delphinae)]|nr:hypothetical protein [Candidatus Thiodiazotropha sp. (ex Epidulcina cf. delphinae)]
MTEPTQIRAGDIVSWEREELDYAADNGWTLHYALRGPSEIDIESVGAGAWHTIDLTSENTAAWVAGDYKAVVYVVSDAGERVTLGSGMIRVLPDLVAAVGDQRSHVKRTLDALRAMIERRASKIQEEYEVEGHRVKYMPLDILIKLRDRYARMYENEQVAAGVKPRSPRSVKFNFR